VQTRRYFIARVYADYDAALQTIELMGEFRDLHKAQAERRALNRAVGPADQHTFLVSVGRTWEEAERELKARLGE
jgi:hypothetical protein